MILYARLHGYLFFPFYLCILLGDKNIVRNIIVSLALTLFLYLFFGVLLKVNLPRGTVPALRNLLSGSKHSALRR